MRSISPARPPSRSPIPAAIWCRGSMSISAPAPCRSMAAARSRIGTTVGSFTAALNTALGGNGSASFTNGQLSISATGGNGVVVQDDATTPSRRAAARASRNFSASTMSSPPRRRPILATGLVGFGCQRPGGGRRHRPVAQGPGRRHRQAGQRHHHGRQTIGNVVSALNSAMGGAATFTLNSDGSISHRQVGALFRLSAQCHRRHHPARHAPASASPNCSASATTIWPTRRSAFAVAPAVANAPQRIGFGHAQDHRRHRRRRYHRHGRRQFRRHRAAERHHRRPQLLRGGRHLRRRRASLSDYAASFYQRFPPYRTR